MVNNTTIEWLLSGAPWVRLGTLMELMHLPEIDTRLQTTRAEMMEHPLVKALLAELLNWPRPCSRPIKEPDIRCINYPS